MLILPKYTIWVFNKNVDIKFSAQDGFLEWPSSGRYSSKSKDW